MIQERIVEPDSIKQQAYTYVESKWNLKEGKTR